MCTQFIKNKLHKYSDEKTTQEELAFYIENVKSSPIFEYFWTTYENELPYLSTLVRSFNIRPATSVASESLFSIASYVHRKQRILYHLIYVRFYSSTR